MSILDFFLTPKARKRVQRRDRRHAFRDAEKAIDSVKERQVDLEREAKTHWEAARTALKNGEKAAAQRALTSYRASQSLVVKLEQKRWIFEQYLTKLQVAESDTQFAEAMSAINKVIKIDPERVEDVFETAQDTLDEQLDSEKFWGKLYNKEMAGAAGALQDKIPSMEELDKQLEEEVAADLGGAATVEAAGELDAKISAGQDRIKNILDSK